MAGATRRCLRALSLLSVSAFVLPPFASGELAPVLTTGQGHELVGFSIAGGREWVALAPAGLEIFELSPSGGGEGVEVYPDPVSRFVVTRGGPIGRLGLELAAQAPTGGILRPVGVEGEARIAGRITQHAGAYLPFAMLRLRYDGTVPNPGTPLLDASGKVAAVHYQGIDATSGFAVPVEVLGLLVHGIRTHGAITRGWMGFAMDPSSREAVVTRVVPDSPAERAGLRAGDLLLAAGQRKIGDYGEAVNALFFVVPGERVPLRVRRDTVEMQLEVVPEVAGR